jgi:hypothetical protein
MILGSEFMFMSLHDEVRDLIGEFYDGEITARQFRERFAPMYAASDMYVTEVQNLLIDIDAIYSGYITDRIDEMELRKQLFDFLPSTRVEFSVPVIDASEIWNVPIAITKNNSPRMPSSTRAKSRPVDINLHR